MKKIARTTGIKILTPKQNSSKITKSTCTSAHIQTC